MLTNIHSITRGVLAAALLLSTSACAVTPGGVLTLDASYEEGAAALQLRLKADLSTSNSEASSPAPLAAEATDFVRAASAALPGTMTDEQATNVRHIIRAFAEHGDGDIRSLAYIFATAIHESRLRPVRETFAATDAGAIRALDHWAKRTTRTGARYWARREDGNAYYGRGFVQLTHRENYARLGAVLGTDLVSDPDRALDPTLAADILVVGMVHGLFVPTAGPLGAHLEKGDLKGARTTVNGTDVWGLIAGYYRTILKELARKT